MIVTITLGADGWEYMDLSQDVSNGQAVEHGVMIKFWGQSG